jgi:hypothetical protein
VLPLHDGSRRCDDAQMPDVALPLLTPLAIFGDKEIDRKHRHFNSYRHKYFEICDGARDLNCRRQSLIMERVFQLQVSAGPACQYLHQPCGLMTPSIMVQ